MNSLDKMEDYDRLQSALLALSKERDELAAQVEVMRGLLQEVQYGFPLRTNLHGRIAKALSITPSEALFRHDAEVAAQVTVMKNALNFVYYNAPINSRCKIIIQMLWRVKSYEHQHSSKRSRG